MKIENTTHWRTTDLMRLFKACCKQEGMHHRRRVEVEYSKSGRVNGVARIHGVWIKMRIPRKKAEQESIASVFIHELAHNRGVMHENMSNPMRCCCRSLGAWAKDYVIRSKEVKQKPKRNLVQERHIHAKKMLLKHQKILTRENTLVKKWDKKVRYYENRAI